MRCENGDCNASYHLYCFDRLRGVNGACMACQAMFAEVQPTAVGERAVPRTEDGHRRASHRKRKRGVRHIMNGNGHAAASDDEDGDQDEGEADLEEEEVDGGRTQSQTSQSQSQSHGGPVSWVA